MEKNLTTPHAVLVSSPGMGHLNPFLGLGSRLSSLHSFKVTVLYVNSSQAAVTAGKQHSDVNLVNIPGADISNKVEPGAHLVTRICTLMRETKPSIRAAISGLRPTVLIMGMFATEYLAIAREMGLPAFVFIHNAWLLALTVYLPVLDKEVEGEYIEQTHPLVIPGCKAVRPEDVVDPMLKRSEPQYAEFLRIGAEFSLFDGVFVMTWEDAEGSTLTALRQPGSILPIPVYDIGPMHVVVEPYASTGEAARDEEMLMEWLDRQPGHSVLYISFGSGGTLSKAQMNDLALGLELSQQRFVWVVRPPTDGDLCGSYFGLKGPTQSNDSSLYLPQGFKERTQDVGRLVHQWAPQAQVLAHPSLGGFMTLCGWNSVLESLTNGVPMMAWPMFADQRLNATLAVEELQIAIRICDLPGEKIVPREEIGRKVRELILEGGPMRFRTQELKNSAAHSLTPAGSSTNRLSQFVRTLINLADA